MMQVETLKSNRNPLVGMVDRAKKGIEQSGQAIRAAAKYVRENPEVVKAQVKEAVKEGAPATIAGATARIAMGAGLAVGGVAAAPAIIAAGAVGRVASSVVSVERGINKHGLKGYYEKQIGNEIVSTQKSVVGTIWDGVKALTYGSRPRKEATKWAFKTNERREKTAKLSTTVANRSTDEVLEFYREQVRCEAGYEVSEAKMQRRVAAKIRGDMADVHMARVMGADRGVARENQSTRQSFNTLAKVLKTVTSEEVTIHAVRQARKQTKQREMVGRTGAALLQMPGQMLTGGVIGEKILGAVNFIGEHTGLSQLFHGAVQHIRQSIAPVTMNVAAVSIVNAEPTAHLNVSGGESLQTYQEPANHASFRIGVHENQVQAVTPIRVSDTIHTSSPIEITRNVPKMTPQLPKIERFTTVKLSIGENGSVSQALADAKILSVEQMGMAGSGKTFVDTVLTGLYDSGKISEGYYLDLTASVKANPTQTLGELWRAHPGAFHSLDRVEAGDTFVAKLAKTSAQIRAEQAEIRFLQREQILDRAFPTSTKSTNLQSRFFQLTKLFGNNRPESVPPLSPPNVPPIDPPSEAPPTGHYEAKIINGRKVIVLIKDSSEAANANIQLNNEEVVSQQDANATESNDHPVQTSRTEYKKVLENGRWVIKAVPVDQVSSSAPITNPQASANLGPRSESFSVDDHVRQVMDDINNNGHNPVSPTIQPVSVVVPEIVMSDTNIVQEISQPVPALRFDMGRQELNMGVQFSSNLPQLEKPLLFPYEWKPVPFKKFWAFDGVDYETLTNPSDGVIAVYGGLDLTGEPGERVALFTCAEYGQKRTLVELVSDATSDASLQKDPDGNPTVFIAHADGWFYPNKEAPKVWNYGIFEPVRKMVADTYKQRNLPFGQWLDLSGDNKITLTSSDGKSLVYKGLRAIVVDDLKGQDLESIIKMVK